MEFNIEVECEEDGSLDSRGYESARRHGLWRVTLQEALVKAKALSFYAPLPIK
ncbi:MAG: hypothetical protein M5U34_40590 [Chloroflexi bacterium]|nr:hypothetical protein [Chloroflexota bacterium]